MTRNISAGGGINRDGEGIIRAGYENNRQVHQNKLDF